MKLHSQSIQTFIQLPTRDIMWQNLWEYAAFRFHFSDIKQVARYKCVSRRAAIIISAVLSVWTWEISGEFALLIMAKTSLKVFHSSPFCADNVFQANDCFQLYQLLDCIE